MNIKKPKNKIIYTLLSLVLSVSFVGCTQPTLYKTSNTRIAATQQTLHQDQVRYNAMQQPPVVIHAGYYVNPTPYILKQYPQWMMKPIVLQAQNLPFGILMNRLLLGSGMAVTYDHSVSPLLLVSINYSGDVKGALDRLASITRFNYSISGYSVDWSAFVDKTFNISFMPGTSNYMVGQSQIQQTATSNTTQTGQSTPLDDSQYSNMQGQLSIWADLARTLNELKSKEGKVIVSESTTSVTVHDYAYNVDQMSKYINQLNQSLSQEVGIRIQVIEVDLDNNYNFGINWNLVEKALGTQMSLTGDLSTATNLVATNLTSGAPAPGLAGFQVGGSSSNVLLNALSQQGKVRVATKPQVVTMNNQVASIRITQDTGYIQSISSSQFDQYETTSITPGTVTDGFTLYVLPKIQGNQVYMQISSRIANLVALEKVSNEPAGATTQQSSTTSTQYSAIEVPTIDSKEFNQRSVVQSGSTLIIAGYKRLSDETQNAKMFGISALGGQGAKQDNVETLVLITPIILKSAG